MHKHGGDDTHPLTANEDGAGVIGAPGHELIVGGIHGANTTQHHGDVDGAVDANEKIRSGRSSPGRPPAAYGRRWRECTSAGGENFRTWSWGITSHPLTLKHF